MKEVCDLLPECVDNINLETTGWHRGCYQAFTKNLVCSIGQDVCRVVTAGEW